MTDGPGDAEIGEAGQAGSCNQSAAVGSCGAVQCPGCWTCGKAFDDAEVIYVAQIGEGGCIQGGVISAATQTIGGRYCPETLLSHIFQRNAVHKGKTDFSWIAGIEGRRQGAAGAWGACVVDCGRAAVGAVNNGEAVGLGGRPVLQLPHC